ncbi:nucleoside hydrolase [Pyrrhoderma noxium]|uniref:Nucleoside hydrolase n=1 Tax=Pyrrhoderma noxium TaxID=2282107 RepID=A0A286UGT7_9AGAM|nr:nucleoside hydrolase [Pyrrhoderma noxium]
MRAETIQSGGSDALELYDLVAMWCAIVTPPQKNTESGHTSTAVSSLGLQNGWESTNRVFQVERFGEITRGMLVVDRTQLQSGILFTDSNNNNNNNGSTNMGTGVPTITRTPGEGALVASMIARIWGCCLTINQV